MPLIGCRPVLIQLYILMLQRYYIYLYFANNFIVIIIRLHLLTKCLFVCIWLIAS